MGVTEDFRLSMTIVYFCLSIPLNVLSWFIMYTSLQNVKKYLIFRCKGIVYIYLFGVYLVIEPFINVSQIVILNFDNSLVGQIVTSFQTLLIMSIMYSLVGRQIILSKIFKTFKLISYFKLNDLLDVLLPPILAPVIYVIFIEIPFYLNIVYEVPVLRDISYYISYIYVAVFLAIYITVAFLNTKIPVKLYTDYYTNIQSCVLSVIITIIWTTVSETQSGSELGRARVNQGLGTVTSLLILHTSFYFLLLRPSYAIWRNQTEYINKWEKKAFLHYEPKISSSSQNLAKDKSNHNETLQVQLAISP